MRSRACGEPGASRRRPAGSGRCFFAGATPAALCGAEVVGISPTAARGLGRSSAAAAGVGGPGAAPGQAWAVQAGQAQHNPAVVGLIAPPLVRLAKEWWDTTAEDAVTRSRALGPKELVSAYHHGAELFAKARRWADYAHHPVALACHAAKQAG